MSSPDGGLYDDEDPDWSDHAGLLALGLLGWIPVGLAIRWAWRLSRFVGPN